MDTWGSTGELEVIVDRTAGWPEIGQPWPAGPSRCPACAQVMSTSRRG